MSEICYECGRSVGCGSGRFISRIPSLSDHKERESMGAAYPEGGRLCAECDDTACRKVEEMERERFYQWVERGVIADVVFAALGDWKQVGSFKNAQELWLDFIEHNLADAIDLSAGALDEHGRFKK